MAKVLSNSAIAQATVLNTANGQNLLGINGIVQIAAIEHDIYIYIFFFFQYCRKIIVKVYIYIYIYE